MCTIHLQVKNAFLPQYLGQYSGPWHVAQALRASPYATQDIDAADVVYVFDYCYYTWWLAFVHSNGRVTREEATPGDHLLKGYQVAHQCCFTRLRCLDAQGVLPGQPASPDMAEEAPHAGPA